jgi:hypothetical protein
MKTILLTFLLFLSTLQAQSAFRFHINNINLPINNVGTLADVNIPPDGTLGRYLGIGFLFSGGFWLSGYSEDTLWANGQASSCLIENYQPGNVGSNPYDPRYKIYVVKETDQPFGPSWQEWIFAVGIGAEFYDGDNDGVYIPVDLNSNGQWDPDEDRPDIIGDQVAWCVFNDGVTPRWLFENVPPLGIEINQTVFGYSTYNAPQLKNILFIRYKITNKGTVNSILDSVYFSSWADADIGNYWDDLAGSDTLTNSGFTYGLDPDSAGFGEEVPAFFINLLQGPYSYIPGETFIDNNFNGTYEDSIDTPLDTAYNHQGLLKGIQIFPGAKNQIMTAFTHSTSCSDPLRGTPYDEFEARNYMLGLLKSGEPMDPCDDPWGGVFGGVPCETIDPLFWYSGDPVSTYGWLNTELPADQRMQVHTGPFSLEVDKPITIIVGYTIGQGDEPVNSVTVGKEVSAFVQQFYQSNFDDNILPVEKEENLIVDDFKLYQNYPNPFNPTTNIKYQIPELSFVTLKIYDVLGNEIATLVSEEKQAGSYEIEFNSTGLLYQTLPSAVYFYQLRAGDPSTGSGQSFVETKKMILMK